MSLSLILRLAVLGTVGGLAAGCVSPCTATPEKLSALRRGMSYAETAQVMGCEGSQVSPASVASGGLATMAWGGPGRPLSTHTLIEFENGHLLSFTTGQRYGL
ncbi:hypothetical protein SAMN02745126_03126 [Enhydrobacter aerosaccus]|uniref:SmpA / OmlA family protein n=1 Tax=Enhydrobacter aerosaccus TaxID=225324 RepID=A0A1T4QCD8_9HYPH|nr:hypothetical protein [Enhydrobacter aerosaccus]SKA01211.1 hypothetical protein SAMN02745126_03126 [Enhydrobacter aerosaccus]